MDMQLKDKTALVSGSTAGIGRAIAEGLAAEGATVIVNGRTEAAVTRAVSEMSAANDGQVLGFAGDLSDAAVAQALATQHPEVDIVVNNLGIFAVQPFEEIPDSEWQRFFDVNVLSGVRLSRLYLAHMRKRNWGRIIFISSESGMHIPAEMVHYGMTKAAQIAVARGLAESLAGTGITVNSVLPGPTRSRGVGDFVADWAAKSGKTAAQVEAEFFLNARPTSLLKRFTTPAEVAAMVTYVASPRSAATTGAALRADGGTVKSAF
jgi:NAD(P)-dependent dehydrogenase (short-subunit alcohol dehydrogenase family)